MPLSKSQDVLWLYPSATLQQQDAQTIARLRRYHLLEVCIWLGDLESRGPSTHFEEHSSVLVCVHHFNDRIYVTLRLR